MNKREMIKLRLKRRINFLYKIRKCKYRCNEAANLGWAETSFSGNTQWVEQMN